MHGFLRFLREVSPFTPRTSRSDTDSIRDSARFRTSHEPGIVLSVTNGFSRRKDETQGNRTDTGGVDRHERVRGRTESDGRDLRQGNRRLRRGAAWRLGDAHWPRAAPTA